jgi:hypothetical protein
MIRFITALAALLLLSTCCPSLWMTVTKGNPTPRFFVAHPEIAAVPIPSPPTFDNRVDLFKAGHPTRLEDAYTSSAEELPPHRIGEAFDALTRIIADFGDPNVGAIDPLGPNPVCGTATVHCSQLTPVRICRDLTIEQPEWLRMMSAVRTKSPARVFATKVVRIKSDTKMVVRPVMSCGPNPTVAGWRQTTETCELDTHVVPNAAPQPGDWDPRVTGATFEMTASLPFDHKEQVTLCLSDEVRLADTLLSFVHMSDIQIRDGSVRLQDRELSRRLDWAIPSFEYDDDLQNYNPYVVDALFATINEALKLPRGDRPEFVMHTGDAIDSGMRSELRLVHELIDRLKLPFFDVLGNHDILVFGNMLPTESDSDTACISAESLAHHYFHAPHWLLPNKVCIDAKVKCPNCFDHEAEFVAAAKPSDTRKTFVDTISHESAAHVPQLADDAYSCTTNSEVRAPVFTFAHGFDLNLADKHLGYYAFPVPLHMPNDEKRHALMVVLDTEDLSANVGGVEGEIGQDQVDWLERTLNCARNTHDIVLVFAHHPPSMVKTPGPRTLDDILTSHKPNVVGYFYGHFHEHGLCRDARSNTCKNYWEIETGSVIEFPQEARMVRIKSIGGGIAFFEVSTFGENEKVKSREVELAHRGAERDFCMTKDRDSRNFECSAEMRPYRADGRYTNARLFFKLP